MAKKCAAGHKSCTGRGPYCVAPGRAAEIDAQARSGENWASIVAYGPGCICGAGQRTLDAAIGLKGALTDPRGLCARHPGGSVHGSPEGA